MHINLTGHHVDLTPALRDYVTAKLSRLERYFDSVASIHVVLSVEKLRQKVEATAGVAGGNLHAVATDADMYAAIDALADKLERQVKRYKEKLTNHHRDDGGLKAMAAPEQD